MEQEWLKSRSTVDLIGYKLKLQMELEALQQEIAGRPFTSKTHDLLSTHTAQAAGIGALDSGTKMHTFPSGARRSELKPRYDLIPSGPLRRLADRYTLGANLYGDYNWQKGMPLSDTFNHILDHLYRWNSRRNDPHKQAQPPDDDLAAAAWGCFALMYFEEHGPTKQEPTGYTATTKQENVNEDREDVRAKRVQGDVSAAQRGRMDPLGGDGAKYRGGE